MKPVFTCGHFNLYTYIYLCYHIECLCESAHYILKKQNEILRLLDIRCFAYIHLKWCIMHRHITHSDDLSLGWFSTLWKSKLFLARFSGDFEMNQLS